MIWRCEMRAWWVGFVVGAAVGVAVALAVLERYQWMPYRFGPIQSICRTDRWTGDMFDPMMPRMQAASDEQRAARRGRKVVVSKPGYVVIEPEKPFDPDEYLRSKPDPYAGLGTVVEENPWDSLPDAE
jgi:hypothetical protein